MSFTSFIIRIYLNTLLGGLVSWAWKSSGSIVSATMCLPFHTVLPPPCPRSFVSARIRRQYSKNSRRYRRRGRVIIQRDLLTPIHTVCLLLTTYPPDYDFTQILLIGCWVIAETKCPGTWQCIIVWISYRRICVIPSNCIHYRCLISLIATVLKVHYGTDADSHDNHY